jgi:hypothetical protein
VITLLIEHLSPVHRLTPEKSSHCCRELSEEVGGDW